MVFPHSLFDDISHDQKGRLDQTKALSLSALSREAVPRMEVYQDTKFHLLAFSLRLYFILATGDSTSQY